MRTGYTWKRFMEIEKMIKHSRVIRSAGSRLPFIRIATKHRNEIIQQQKIQAKMDAMIKLLKSSERNYQRLMMEICK